jgi:hypothetical protein
MEIFGIALLVLLGGISIIALFATLTLLIPDPIEKTRASLEKSLGRSLLLGLVNFIFFAVIIFALIWLAEGSGEVLGGVLSVLAGVILLGLVIFALLGLASTAKLLGERIGGDKSDFQKNIRGGTLLLLAGLAPYVGWFLFTPLLLLTGLGGAISALVRRRDKKLTTEENEAP